MTDYFRAVTKGRTHVEQRFCRELPFPARRDLRSIEEGELLMPRFGDNGLIPCVAQEAVTGEVLMLGYMNREALSLTIQSGYAHYWSPSRAMLWHKDRRSGKSQAVEQILIDDDQDCVLLKVRLTGGAYCHAGYRSCFFRQLRVAGGKTDFGLRFLENARTLEPVSNCGGRR